MLLTILIPSYNIQKEKINRNLSSILNVLKKTEELEVIFIDDADENNSYKLAENVIGKMPNTKIIRNKENLGLVKTTLNGIKLANGKYFQRVDADDFVDSKELLNFIEWIKTVNHDLIVNDWILQNYGRKYSKASKKNGLNTRTVLFTPTITHKTEVIKKISEPEVIDSFLEDKWFILNAINMNNNNELAIYSRKAWYVYDGQNTSNVKYILKNLEHYRESVKEILEIESENETIIYQQLRVIVGLSLFEMMTHDAISKVNVIRKNLKLIKRNKELFKFYKKNYLFKNIYRWTFIGGYSPLIFIIIFFLKRK